MRKTPSEELILEPCAVFLLYHDEVRGAVIFQAIVLSIRLMWIISWAGFHFGFLSVKQFTERGYIDATSMLCFITLCPLFTLYCFTILCDKHDVGCHTLFFTVVTC